MAREFSVVVGINATKAVAGARTFKAGADQVVRSNRRMQVATASSTRRMTAMITTMGRFRGVASLMFAGFLGVGGISAVVRTLATFEAKMAQVNALLGDRGSTQIMRVLTERARELGATTAFTASQAAEGMKFLTLAGFDALEVFQAIGPALTLAQAGALGLGEAADIVSNVMAAFSIEASEVVDVVDALAFVSSRSNTNIQQLGQAMKFVAPVAGALGVKVDETAVALGILGNAGLQASLAGTSLRRVMSGLLNPSKEATAVFAQMGVTSQELVGFLDEEDGLVKIVEALAKAGLDAAQAFTLFGQRGAPGVLALVAQKEELRDLTKATREAEGAAAKMAETMVDTLAGDAKIAISALAEAILQLGDAGFTQWLRDSTQSFTGFIRGMTGMTAGLAGMTQVMQESVKTGQAVRENWEAIKKVAIVLATVLGRNVLFGAFTKIGLAMTAIRAAGAAVLGTFALMRAGAFSLTVAIRGLSAAFLASPLGIALLVGSLLAYVLTGDDAEETSRKNADALDAIIKAGNDAALTFDKVATASEKMFKLEQVTDAIKAQREVVRGTSMALKEFKAAQEALPEAQARVAASSDALKEATDGGRSALHRWAIESTNARNALTELETVIEANTIDELQAAADLAWREFQKLMETASNMNEVLDGNRTHLDAAAEAAERAATIVREAKKAFAEITGVTVEWNASLKKTVDGLLPMIVAQEKARSALVDIRIALEKTDEQLIKMGQSRENLTRAEQEAEFQLKKSLRAETALEKARSTQLKTLEDLRDEVKDLKDDTGGLAKLTREYTRDVLESALAVAAGTLTLEEYAEKVALLKDRLELAKTALSETCDKTDKLKECMSENAKAMDALWDQAMRNIQDSFADAFRNIGDGFDDFAKGILDAFKDMLAQMAAQAAISNLFGQGGGFFNDFFGGITGGGGGGGGFGGALGRVTGGGGGSGGSGGAAGTGPLASAQGYINNALSSLASMATAFAHGAGAFLTGAGGTGVLAGNVAGGATTSAVSVFNTGAQNAAIANSGSFTAGGVAAGAGIGALTGIVVDAILGGRGDPVRGAIFATIGGAIGSIWGPIGSVVGGAIGAFVDNIFGGAKKLEKATLELDVVGTNIFAIQSEIISKQKSFFRGRSFKETRKNISNSFNGIEATFAALVFTMEDLAAEFGMATDFIETFEFARDINIKGKNAEARIEAAIRDLFQSVTDAFLDDVEGLPERMKLTLDRFSGNLEHFIRALEATAGIERLFDIDLLEASSQAIEDSQVGIIETYQNALGAYNEVIEGYDGGIESLEQLTLATAIFTQVQLDLITVYQQLGTELSGLFQDSAQTIREALLSEEELFNLRKSQIDELVLAASLTTDPEELAALAAEINRLGLENFNSLDADQQAALGPEFIEFFEGLDTLFGEQIAEGIGSVVQDQADADLAVAVKMEEAAQAILDAARALQEEADRRREENEFRDEMHR